MMDDERKKDSDEGVKRFLTDFRSHTERRSFEERRTKQRRSGGSEVKDERRGDEDRRDKYDRREMLLDRRRGTPEQFILEHVVWIREALHNSETDVECPRCGGNLLLGTPIKRGAKYVREIHCTACRHRVVLPDKPDVSGS
jgi:DNA-directed RNA polymerase subunit RPC12/RpoP